MRIGRYLVGGRAVAGQWTPTGFQPFGADGVEDLEIRGGPVDLHGAIPLPPCRPSKIIGIGINYRDHARERGKALPGEPLIFLKPPSAILSPGAPIRIPAGAGRVDHEAELAVVIGRPARHLAVAQAGAAILGYTCFNDVTARELQDRDIQFSRAKGFDTFAPFGPWIETDLDPSNLRITCRVNGSIRQDSSTRELIFPIPYLVAYVSRVMTLLPGDLIATGTPSGIGPLKAGDTVEVTVEGIGTLVNPVEN